jgi:hypothetical protein
MISGCVSLVLGFALLAPATARAQSGGIWKTTNFLTPVAATANETILVTIVNPPPDPAAFSATTRSRIWRCIGRRWIHSVFQG